LRPYGADTAPIAAIVPTPENCAVGSNQEVAMNTRHVAALVSGLALSISGAPAQPPPLEPASRTMLNMRLSGAVLATFQEQGGRFPEPFPRLVSLERLAPSLGSEFRRELAPRDGWAQPLSVLIADPETYWLISFGADGRPDLDYADLLGSGGRRGRDAETPDPSSPDRDFVFSRGDFLQRPEPPASPTKRAMADLRSIGTAIESFAVDNDVYPGPTAGLVTIDAIAGTLEPIYIKAVPRVDPWGHPYLVSSDGKAYVVVSGGADGALELAYDNPPNLGAEVSALPASVDESADLVFFSGQFVRWPAGESDGGR
jgi:hypothetical protein